MAWTAPPGFTVGSTLTASTANQQLRDNAAIANKWAINYTATGTFTSGVGDGRMAIPYPMTVEGMTASAGSVTGGTFILDLEYTTSNGSTWATMYTTTGNRLSIAQGANNGSAPAPDVTALTTGNSIRLRTLSTLVSVTDMVATIKVSGG